MGDIARSSEEQAKGIEQINASITQMEDVTQNNAANSEESAAASSDLNTQADVLQKHIYDLTSIVVSSSKSNQVINENTVSQHQVERTSRQEPKSDLKAMSIATTDSPNAQSNAGSHLLQQKIPLKGDDFGDFK